RQDDLVENVRPLLPPILPGEESVPGLEAGAGGVERVDCLRHAGEGEIADRHDVRAGVVGARMAAAIAEGVELLHIADGEPGLGTHPRAQADLEGPMRGRVERTEWQSRAGAALAAVAGDENGRLLALDGHDRGGEPDLDRRERGLSHSGSVAPTLSVMPAKAGIQYTPKLRSADLSACWGGVTGSCACADDSDRFG